jgi:selenocysteine-specific elongation factor
MVEAVLEMIDQQGSISAGELRDRFQTTRKYAIRLLEHLDNIKITRRQDDVRVRGPRT